MRSTLRVIVAIAIFVGLQLQAIPADAGEARDGNLLWYTWGGNDLWLNYDQNNPGTRPSQYHVDWAVSMIFTNNASIKKVKDAVDNHYDQTGDVQYMPMQDWPKPLTYDSDWGIKTTKYPSCGQKANHVRFYAPWGDGVAQYGRDRFYSPSIGYYVLATTHVDHNETCPFGGAWFGESEVTEADLTTRYRNCGYRELPQVWLHNYEWGSADTRHRWQNNGYARVISIDKARC